MPRILGVLFACAALLVPVACGNDDDDGPSDETTTTTVDDTTTTTVVDDTTTTTGDEAQSLPAGEWQIVVNEDTGLAAYLPGTPEEIDEEVAAADGGTVRVMAYIVEEATAAWSFTVYQHGVGQWDLNDSMQGTAEGIGGSLVDSSETTVGGRPAIDGEVSFTAGTDEGVAFVRIIDVRDGVVVQFQSLGMESDRADLRAAFERLVDSFESR